MNIASIASEKMPVPPVKGGAIETWNYEVGKRLAENHNVFSFCVHDPLLNGYKNMNGYHVLTYQYNLFDKLLLCTYKLPFKQDKSFLYYWPYAYWCARQCRKLKVEIIHVHARPQFIPILRRLNPKAKIILHVQNVSIFDMAGWLWPDKLWDQVDLMLTCSEYLKNEVIARYPVLKDKTKVVYNGVDVQLFNPDNGNAEAIKKIKAKYHIREGEKVILFSGRLVEYKGAHLLIEVFQRLLKKNSQLKLFIVGCHGFSVDIETPYIKKLKELSRGLEDKIIFTGYVDNAHIPQYIQMCDIQVIPSLWEEPFGVIVIEGMAMGKPIVTFAKGGIKEIVTNGTGMLLPQADAQTLEQGLQRLLDDPAQRETMGQNAQRAVRERFSWEKIVPKVQNYYHELIKDGS